MKLDLLFLNIYRNLFHNIPDNYSKNSFLKFLYFHQSFFMVGLSTKIKNAAETIRTTKREMVNFI